MTLLTAENVRLRALEPQDVDLLYAWENDTAVWGVSQTLMPFSRHILGQFIAQQTQDIYQTRQMRLVIEAVESERPVGVIDLFDFDPYHLRAGVGILIHESRRAGYATGALTLLIRYGFEVLGLHQFYCDIPATNIASQRLFERCGFTRCGQKRQWLKKPKGWEDVYVYQLIR